MTSCGGSDDGNACRAPNGGRWACRLIAEERVNAADSSTVLSESARRTTEVVPEGAADKARAGALGGLKANVRSTIRGTSDDQARKARDPIVFGSRLPPGWKSRCLGGRRRTPAGFSTVSTRGQADAQRGQGLRTERW
jgi:hypothetical protein